MSFTINYKGTACRGTLFLYKCPVCTHEQEEVHAAVLSPQVQCIECCKVMHKKLIAPALDADLHESMLSHNIGGEG